VTGSWRRRGAAAVSGGVVTGLQDFEEIIIDGFFSQYFSIIIAHGF